MVGRSSSDAVDSWRRFHLAAEVRSLGLVAIIGVLRNVTINDSPADLRKEILKAAADLRCRFPNIAALREATEFVAFRTAYARLSEVVRRPRPGCQNLVELAWKRGDLPRVNALVDAYNLVSINRFLSIGAHDLDTLALPVELRLTRGTETFTPLRGTAVDIAASEFGYVDARNRLICRFDVQQAFFSRITPQTRNVFVVVEGTVVHGQHAVDVGCAEVLESLLHYCGGSIDVAVPS
jgi:DNA/RNA-binding domain of Phe-tRNA-synthetase-like protein